MTDIVVNTTSEDVEIDSDNNAWLNLPATLEEAVDRIKALEHVLEDLARSIEIAVAMNQLQLINSFKDSAEQVLKTKIMPVLTDKDPIKIVLVTNKQDSVNA